jgi:putative ABC transport system permease protein
MMPTLALAVAGLRHRAATFAATFTILLLGSTLVMGFGSMLDTAGDPAVTSRDDESLVNMGTIVGGWGAVIVLFAVASTLTLAVRQRDAEMGLLRSVGATPRQVRRMVVGEAAVLGLAAAACAVVPALLVGRLLVDLLHDTGQLGVGVDHRFGVVALGQGLAVAVGASVLAAHLAARRAGRMRAREALLAATLERPGLTRVRRTAAALLLAGGLACAVVTATVFDGRGTDAMQTAAQASILTSIGLALLAPAIVGGVTAGLDGVLRRRGAAGFLANQHARHRRQELARALMPVIVFVGVGTGCFVMQDIENAAVAASGAARTTEQQNVETLNTVVVGMVAAFAAITLVTTLSAATAYRRGEFGRQRLAGATPAQVLEALRLEAVLILVPGVVCGSLAASATVVPFSLARSDGAVPASSWAVWAGIVAAAVALTLVTTLGSARRALRAPAVEAVA